MRSERGFTLLEAVIAFAIAALALSVMFKAAAGGLVAVSTAGRYEEAVSRAKSHLSAIGRDGPLQTLTNEGDDGGGYRWRVHILPVATVNPSANNAISAFVQPSRRPTLFSVEVGISWTEARQTREFLLQTQRLGNAPGDNDG
jgi:general secretion pathway protein I